MDLLGEYGGADFLDLPALNAYAQFCFEKGRKKGRADGAREFAEVIKSQSSEMVQALIDRQLAEWQKDRED